MALDFSLLGNGVDVKGILGSYEAGRQSRIEAETRGALSRYSTDPKGAIGALMPHNPKLALELNGDYVKQQERAGVRDVVQTFGTDPNKAREKAYALGPEAVDAYSKLSTAEKARSDELAETTGRVAFGALTAANGDTPEALAARRSFLTPMSKDLVASGIDPETLKSVIANPTTGALRSVMAKSDAWLKLGVETEQKARDFDAKREDETWKRDMEGKKFSHTVSNDSARLGLEGRRVGVAEQTAARLAGGGTGAAGVGGGRPAKPLPIGVQKMDNEDLGAIAMASQINQRLTPYIASLQAGKLPLGPVSNLAMEARNFAGRSSDESREYGNFRSDLEKMRNDSLRLNKGVQTEGDAQRAWNELFKNLNDPKLVADRLERIQGYNEVAAAARKAKIDDRRMMYGVPSPEYEKYEGRSSAPQTNRSPAPPKDAGATRGQDGKFYAEDPYKPGSFPEISVSADGVWRMKSANGRTLVYK